MGAAFLEPPVSAARAQESPPAQARRVLILHSQSPGEWTRQLDQGLADLRRQWPGARWRVEYLGAGWLPSPALNQALLQVYTQKLAGQTFDLILACDDPALALALCLQASLGARPPLVFCGVSLFDPRQVNGRPVTGVVKHPDLAATLALGRRLRPQAQRVHLISDQTPAAQARLEELREILAREHPDLKPHLLESASLAGLGSSLAALPRQDFAFLLAWEQGPDGDAVTPDQLAPILGQSAAPVLGCCEIMLGRGLLGGNLVCGGEQGRAAARLAHRVLQGEPAGKIPVQTISPNRYIFDQAQLARFDIPAELLPPGSQIRQPPDASFWPALPPRFWLLLGLVGLLMALVAFGAAHLVAGRRAQRALEQGRQKSRAYMDHAPEAIFLFDEQGCIEDINPAAVRMSGFSRDKLLAMRVADLHPPERQEDVAAFMRTLVASGRMHSEFSYRHPQGGQLYLSLRAARIEGRQFIGFCHDITERKWTEKAIRRSEEKLRNLVAASPVGIHMYRLNQEGRLLLGGYNPAAERILGKDHGLLVGKPMPQTLALLAGSGILEHSLRAARTGQSWSTEHVIFHSGRIQTALELRVFQTTRHNVVLMFNDIADRLRAIEDLKNMEAQLVQSQKMEAIGILASGIAHDFNNILQAISGNVQLLLDSPHLDHDHLDRLHRVEGSVRRAAELVSRLLSFSRRAGSNLEQVDLNEQVMQAVKMLEHTLPKMISLRTELGQSLRLIRADRNQIEQIILNLSANARDAMPEGGALTIRSYLRQLESEQEPGAQGIPPGLKVVLEVSDTGQGMDQETIRHLFEPFFTSKEVGQGTGLGLYSVYGIVQNHGARILCHSRPGQGSTFTIFFPALAQGARPAPLPVRRPAPPATGGETVLVVDDEEHILDSCREALTLKGYQVLTAASGEQALQVLTRQMGEVDLVVLDIGMPGMGGKRALELIMAQNPKALVLVASGYSSSDQVRIMLEAGARGFVAKPYSFADLLEQIHHILHPSQTEQLARHST